MLHGIFNIQHKRRAKEATATRPAPVTSFMDLAELRIL
jgi:hypothetical protein